MIKGSIARRYAKALLGIGIETNQFETFSKELDRLVQALSNEELGTVLKNPSYPLTERKAILRQLLDALGLSTMIRNFMFLLMERNRLAWLPSICREFQGLVDLHVGQIRALVKSAEPLDGPSIERLKTAIERMTGKRALLECIVDPELIGGIVTSIGSMVYDGSIRNRLETLRERLLTADI